MVDKKTTKGNNNEADSKIKHKEKINAVIYRKSIRDGIKVEDRIEV